MNPDHLVIDSANAAISTVGTRDFATLAERTLGFVGAELARHVKPADKPGLFSPLDVEREGKLRAGAVLALPNRAIIAWAVGTLRMKNFESELPYDSILGFERNTRPGGNLTKPREVLRITARGGRWELVFANVFEGGRSIVPFLQGAMDGSVTPSAWSE